MKSSKDIRVEYLCHQPFWNFRKSGDDTFCKHCRENIYDFRDFSQEEIRQKLKENGGSICGTFYKDQILIDDRTSHSPGILKLALVSMISLFAIKGYAKREGGQPVKTEQHVYSDIFLSTSDSTATTPDEVDVEPKPEPHVHDDKIGRKERKGTTLFHIGMSRIFISWRFPFLHVRRNVRGRAVRGKF